MVHPDHLSRYYPGEALQAMEQAHADTGNSTVGSTIEGHWRHA
jgi:hypothetical protein